MRLEDSRQHQQPRDDSPVLQNYFDDQAAKTVYAKTVAAMGDLKQSTASTARKQMMSVLRKEGLYKKCSAKKFEKFKMWLECPGGGEVRSSGEIISEVNRFLHFSEPVKVVWEKLHDTKLFNRYLIQRKF